MWRLHFNGSESIGSELQIRVSRGSSCIRFFALRSSEGEEPNASCWTFVKCQWCYMQNAECSQVGDMNRGVAAPSCWTGNLMGWPKAGELGWGWDNVDEWVGQWVGLDAKSDGKGKSNPNGFRETYMMLGGIKRRRKRKRGKKRGRRRMKKEEEINLPHLFLYH